MDWHKQAENDWSIYQDASRIKKYVQFGKITEEQYQVITGESYTS
ncbi:XkdX family protein [Bacillus marasmi]|nr:XkdX family protein [Bacillus marasmi]